MCREGGCGACIVAAVTSAGALPVSVNSCLVSITSCQGWEITTVEKVGNRLKGYHVLQTTLAKYNGTQCGYCTPGWIMAMYSLLHSKSDLTKLEIERSLGSNICRCTGYRPILEAFKKFAVDEPNSKTILDVEDMHLSKKCKQKCSKAKCGGSEWCIVSKQDVEVPSHMIEIDLKDGRKWYKVYDVETIFSVLNENGDESNMLVSGNTAKGAYPIDEYPRILIDVSDISALKGFIVDQNLVVRAGTTLTEAIEIFKHMSKQEYFKYLEKFVDHLKLVAHVPVRNLGTIAGNLMIKYQHNEFPSDVFLLFETVGAQLTIGGIDIKETRPVSDARQIFDTNPSLWPLNQPIPKVEALIQCSGEAPYTEDIPTLPHEVFAAFVLATVPTGIIEAIDPNKALMGVDILGAIQYLNMYAYSDNGYIIDELLATLASDTYFNCYDKSRWNYKIFNTVTDNTSNTWCRAPTTLENIAASETFMERISYELSLDPIQVRLINLDLERSADIKEMVVTLQEKSEYHVRKQAVHEFNITNRWKKRGLRTAFLRWTLQGATYYDVNLSVYHGDGTVAIVHSGIEMGQGVNTKAVQIAAYFLKIPIDKVEIKANDTMITPNSQISAASFTSQYVGIGVQKCCEELNKRLEPIRKEMPNASWEEVIKAAYKAGVDLQTHGFVGPNDRSNYDIFGVTFAEVEIDVLTGEFEILRVDILQDVGLSVSPEIDIGQVEGAFIMGLGYWTSEHLVYDENTGELLTDRTWNYYVPQARDIPQDFRVYFRKNSYGPSVVLGAKSK
ncbi:hypothetical protein O0L34_g13676 [Tuta absoluta]|nr:hypothetical protein O0L34_g13676 [Tuta absoluta]